MHRRIPPRSTVLAAPRSVSCSSGSNPCPRRKASSGSTNRSIFALDGTGRSRLTWSPLALNLVVEIDGYYHFQDPSSYRRDRRKDVELQQHGYLVVRVLAEDVVCRLDEVLDTILTAVVSCRQHAHREPRQHR